MAEPMKGTPEVPPVDVKHAEKIPSDMACTSSETVAEKAAADQWLEKERARRRPRSLQMFEKVRRAGEDFAAGTVY
jgi:hypothetical protein